ncbi:hypothetical protein [Chryseobacterium sp. YIM B08800]|uniref:hypothetical protein n=1 Tax=Chryseobacterium sp. YIM B08800 TaxID=2984136 RepID=UPI00223ED234|nr:hypothetical protein [Chryseobacterium sp. YIM B08800]
MKNFIEIRDVDTQVYKLNINQISYFYRPQVATESIEREEKTIWTRIMSSNNIEFTTRTSIQDLEKMIKEAQEK